MSSEEAEYSMQFLQTIKVKVLKEFAEKLDLEEINDKNRNELIEEINQQIGFLWFEKASKFLKVEEMKELLESVNIKEKSNKKAILQKHLLEYIKSNSYENIIYKNKEKTIEQVVCNKLMTIDYVSKEVTCEQILITEMINQLSKLPSYLLIEMCKDCDLDVNQISGTKLVYSLMEGKLVLNTPISKNTKKREQLSESSEEEERSSEKKKKIKKRKSTNKEKSSPKKTKKKLEEDLVESNSVEDKHFKNNEELKDRIYTITGKLSLKRNVLIDLIKKRGFTYTDDILKATHVVSNDPFYNTKKIVYARKNQIPIIHDSYFADMMDK